MVDVPSICAVPGCGKAARTKGLCAKHYMRQHRHGDPAIVLVNRDSDWRPRFWAKVDRDGPVPECRPDLGPCWLWTSTKDRKGYGYFSIKGAGHAAHRLAYELLVGPIPEGLEPDHLCRVHACVRPTHLEPVTHLENVRRGLGTYAINQTHCVHGHEYTAQNTGRKPGTGRRYCLTCAQINQREYFVRNRDRDNRRRRLARQRRKMEHN